MPLGFATRLYTGPGAGSLGGVPYEVFWCLVVQLLLPRAQPGRIALSVLAVTCALEVLQLWHPPPLEALRAHWIGRSVLGHAFSWSDFPPYVAGSALGWWWLGRLRSGAAAPPSGPASASCRWCRRGARTRPDRAGPRA